MTTTKTLSTETFAALGYATLLLTLTPGMLNKEGASQVKQVLDMAPAAVKAKGTEFYMQSLVDMAL